MVVMVINDRAKFARQCANILWAYACRQITGKDRDAALRAAEIRLTDGCEQVKMEIKK